MPEYRGGWALCQERTHEPNSPVDCSRELSYRLLAERPSAPDTTYRAANRRTPTSLHAIATTKMRATSSSLQ